MSTALAIASVTYVIKDLLNNGVIDHEIGDTLKGEVKVTALPPDRVDATVGTSQNQLNIYMYQATPNAAYRNVDYPAFDKRGDRIGNPPLALDLHYILTAYSMNELHSEILLGYGMQLLHEIPVLNRDDIRISLGSGLTIDGGLPDELLALSTSGLADQVEQVKLTPETLTTGEIFNLWAAFQAKYRPSAAYKATVVLIEGHRSTKSSLPVLKRKLAATPFVQPVLTGVSSQAVAGGPIVKQQKILPGYRLVLGGSQLSGDGVSVEIEGVSVTPAAADISDNQVIVAIPPGLSAGSHSVYLSKSFLLGSPPVPHPGFASNAEAFMLSPVIDTLAVSGVTGAGTAPRSATIGFNVTPAIGSAQNVLLLLNQLLPAASTDLPHSYSFSLPPASPTSPPGPPGPLGSLSIPVSGVAAGTYFVRIRVDGAESPLGTDVNGKYNSPTITIN